MKTSVTDNESTSLAGRGWRWRTLARRARYTVRTLVRPAYWLYEKRLYQQVARDIMPQHLGLILDGNRRFARARGMDVRLGHEYGVHKVHDVLGWCLNLGIPHVTIFVFSTENFQRAPEEVDYLLNLFAQRCRELLNHGVGIRIIGQRSRFPEPVLRAVRELEAAPAAQCRLRLNVALGYGGREEIVDAVRALLRQAAAENRSLTELADSMSAAQIGQHLYTAGVPDPDFIIRTSGELRLSGFCLWQSAYSEYYFCDALWPAFRRIDFLRALRNYQERKRRFGR